MIRIYIFRADTYIVWRYIKRQPTNKLCNNLLVLSPLLANQTRRLLWRQSAKAGDLAPASMRHRHHALVHGASLCRYTHAAQVSRCCSPESKRTRSTARAQSTALLIKITSYTYRHASERSSFTHMCAVTGAIGRRFRYAASSATVVKNPNREVSIIRKYNNCSRNR